ncbi:MAG TPA: leucyl aminopeptidase [Terriglobales bacterium]|nr:leucyl aminopeptidase [Terriglobales bacterium]
MKTEISFSSPSQIETECLVAVVLDRSQNGKSNPSLETSDKAVAAAAADLLATGELSGKMFETTMVHRPQGLKAKRLLLVGGGKADNFSGYELRKLAGAAVRFLKPKSIRQFAFIAPENWTGQADPAAHSTYVFERGGPAEALKAIAEGAFVGNFDPDTYKSDRKDQRVEHMTVVASGKQDETRLRRALEEGCIIGESQNFTRDLVNEPSNRLTPTVLADRAKEMVRDIAKNANGFPLSIETHGADKIRELKMGAFWSVAQGSDEPPALIIIKYEPEGAPQKPVLGLVGKGITFDTGGISIKPADGMEKMKYDMAGGAAMLGAMRAIALLRPKIKVIAIVCATENMPSGHAQKPGDVQIAMSGKSIEIINTDAEGRLVLADGLHYAKQLGCTHLIDAATLTGACVVALGMVNAGVFANDEEIFQRFSRALERSGEKMWRLPLDEEYKDQIRSSIADIMNTGGRWGGAVNAAMFLKEFAEETPWIHLDIAGTAWMDDNKAWIAKGPSGIAVRSLVEFVRGFETDGGPSATTGGSGSKGVGTQAAQRRADSGAGL